MSDYDVRPLEPRDFDTLMALEQQLFGDKGEKTLGPFYVRLCCDFFSDTCFLALRRRRARRLLPLVRPRPRGVLLDARHRAGAPALAPRLPVRAVVRRRDRVAGRHRVVHGPRVERRRARPPRDARRARDRACTTAYFGPGEPRIVSRIDRVAFEKLRSPHGAPGPAPGRRRLSHDRWRRAIGLAGAVTPRLVVEAEIGAREVTAGGTSPGARMRTARTILYVHGVDVRRDGPEPARPCVVVANHLSLPRPARRRVGRAVHRHRQGRDAQLAAHRARAARARASSSCSGAIRTAARPAIRARLARAARRGRPSSTSPRGRPATGATSARSCAASSASRSSRASPSCPRASPYDDDRVPWFGGQTFAPALLAPRRACRASKRPRALRRAADGRAVPATRALDARAARPRRRRRASRYPRRPAMPQTSAMSYIRQGTTPFFRLPTSTSTPASPYAGARRRRARRPVGHGRARTARGRASRRTRCGA